MAAPGDPDGRARRLGWSQNLRAPEPTGTTGQESAARAVSISFGESSRRGGPQFDIVEALAVPQGLYLGCIIACQMSRGYFYSRVVRDSLLRTPGLLGDD